jgi:GRAS domain family
MLSSLQSHEEEESTTNPTTTTSFIPTPSSQYLSPTSSSPRQILLRCAEMIHHGDRPAALRVASFLISAASPLGDSSDRVACHFARALIRLIESSNAAGLNPSTSMNKCGTQLVQPAYLSFNQITPFLRFAHLTANQAILEAIDGHCGVHIIDMDSAHGFQWPPLLQAIAVRGCRGDAGPPSVRITGAGTDVNALRRTADRLHAFARSLGLPFQFNPLYLPTYNLGASLVQLRQPSSTKNGEVLIVNCVLFLHKLLSGDRDERQLHEFLATLRSIGPAVVTIAERELGVASAPQDFIRVFSEALDYYTAVFEALEATVPPNIVERREVEEIWLGEEIKELLVPASSGSRGAGGMRFQRWDVILRESGFTPRRLSEYSLSQARLLLRLHYPSEGYQLHVSREGLFLGWQARPLFSVSSWQ